MTKEECKDALDKRAAALSLIGMERHLVLGKLATLPLSDNIILNIDKDTYRNIFRNRLRSIDERFKQTAGLALETWIYQEKSLT